ncbi:hypothetical protein RBWH47_00153 [Rhodopirellula baltica WH47]|uniref:Uncharacterized protein n=1 Tax=Rhodopirellula baltica WH47 TaxID=991778 RepID=F2B1Z0_RHOBT|nr:hypothetical protein RBWH47_00153 [Rhodopirellula baltica WH47]
MASFRFLGGSDEILVAAILSQSMLEGSVKNVSPRTPVRRQRSRQREWVGGKVRCFSVHC